MSWPNPPTSAPASGGCSTWSRPTSSGRCSKSRELVLRQRFESIIEEVTETRDLLVRLDFGVPQVMKRPQQRPARPADAVAEPGDEPEDSPPNASWPCVCGGFNGQTNSRKNAHETRSVAEAFDDIRLQLINNRIDTEELNRRLAEGIAKPLVPHRRRDVPRAGDPPGTAPGEPRRRATRPPDAETSPGQQADEILLEMRKVLDRMLELEDFNEAVELLRAIIKLQEELEEQTRQRRNRNPRTSGGLRMMSLKTRLLDDSRRLLADGWFSRLPRCRPSRNRTKPTETEAAADAARRPRLKPAPATGSGSSSSGSPTSSSASTPC